MNKKFTIRFILLALFASMLSACSFNAPPTVADLKAACEGKLPGATVWVGSFPQDMMTCTAEYVNGTASEPAASDVPNLNEGQSSNVTYSTKYDPFTPNWSGLSKDCPSRADFLKAHNLTEAQVIFHPAPQVSWRDCQYVIELQPSYYGKVSIPQVNGWFYNEALVGDVVTNMWGGDPKVTEVTLQWGFTATWGPANLDSPYPFVDPNNPCEIVVGDFRFGLYWRLPGIGLPPVEDPYYGRNGPYGTEPGNMYCEGWVPPGLDQVVADDYLQAAALYGGLANEDEWERINATTWKWTYSEKVAGSATYCPTGMPCWQTTYVPQNMKGYVEFWYEGGPKKFYASDLSFLMLDNVNPDEFTVHTSPNN